MDGPTRRTVLRAGVVLAVAAPAAVLLPALQAGAEPLTRDSFLPHTGSLFRLTSTYGETTLRLSSVDDLQGPPVGGKAHRFSLLFRPTAGVSFPQGTYDVIHPRMGTLTLFIVPVGRDGDYQAIFNAA